MRPSQSSTLDTNPACTACSRLRSNDVHVRVQQTPNTCLKHESKSESRDSKSESCERQRMELEHLENAGVDEEVDELFRRDALVDLILRQHIT
eukprot:3044081-Rhodomonas_salina.1